MAAAAHAECPACRQNPRSHSFEHLATLASDGTRIFYTAPALAEEAESPAKLENMRIHLANARSTPWIWILDCSNMETKHTSSMEFVYGIAKTLTGEHEGILRHIVILNGNVWIRCAVAALRMFVRADLVKKLVFADYILDDLRAIELTDVEIRAILRRHYALSSPV
jgi:hypothetical protein